MSLSLATPSRPGRGVLVTTRALAAAAPPTPPRATELLDLPPLKLVGPKPTRFALPAEMPLAKAGTLTIGAAAFTAIVRAGSGGFCSGYKSGLVEDDGAYAVTSVGGRKLRETSDVGSFPRPAQPLVLYEFEGCPFCRKVREAICILDLDVLVLPCPKGGAVWRPQAVARGGKAQFPYLEDPNTGKTLYESDAIISYLFTTYGDGKVPLLLRMGYLTTFTAGLGLAPRAGAGSHAAPSAQPAQPLVYWGYEMSPFCKVAREVLSELELPHLYRCTARGSPKRQALLAKYGHFQVPFLEDPNAGVAMFESTAIMQHLRETYGKPAEQ